MRRDVGEAQAIALEHLQPCEKMMRENHRLRALQVRVAGNQYVAVGFSHGEERTLGGTQFLADRRAGVLEEQPHVRRDLVVATPGGVELGRGRYALRQGLLDVHVHILEPGVPREFARHDVGQHSVEAGVNRIAFRRGDEAHVREHGRVRLASGDVKGREAAVKRDGLAELQHQLRGAGGEPAAPGRMGRLGHSGKR